MRKDERLRKLAENCLKNSVKLKKGEKIYIEGFGECITGLFEEFICVATEMGAIPFYFMNNEAFVKDFFLRANEEQVKGYSENHRWLMEQTDVYVGLRGYDDLFSLSDLSAKQKKMYEAIFYTRVHNEVRVPKTRWCVMRYPSNTMSALAKMSTNAFEDFFFDACLVDYKQFEKEMTPLVNLFKKTDRVKIIAPGTKLEFSVKGIGAVKCCGWHNLPDGEVMSAPVKDSINGYVQFNTDTVYKGEYFSNVYLEFKNGKIIKATSAVNNDNLQDVLNIDAGSKYMGEFALGLNNAITKPILDILFDEKIGGSFHMAIGTSFEDADNGNRSGVHWDLIQMQDKEHGGGEIWFDDVLIRKDGLFVPKELQGLNPKK